MNSAIGYGLGPLSNANTRRPFTSNSVSCLQLLWSRSQQLGVSAVGLRIAAAAAAATWITSFTLLQRQQQHSQYTVCERGLSSLVSNSSHRWLNRPVAVVAATNCYRLVVSRLIHSHQSIAAHRVLRNFYRPTCCCIHRQYYSLSFLDWFARRTRAGNVRVATSLAAEECGGPITWVFCFFCLSFICTQF